jgi:hypothetical protein
VLGWQQGTPRSKEVAQGTPRSKDVPIWLAETRPVVTERVTEKRGSGSLGGTPTDFTPSQVGGCRRGAPGDLVRHTGAAR